MSTAFATAPREDTSLLRYRQRLSDMRRTLDRAIGRRDILTKREEELSLEVGLAKGRLEAKPKVDAFLAELQAEANERAVGTYARLLTGLVGDVLGPHAGTIELELYTNAGLPALDIFVRTAKGKKVSILNHSAGSMINLVSLGLRATSTVRSGKRRFIALDEPDCWTRPLRVPAFYSVIDQLSTNLDLQFLVVSHNDASLLPEGTNIVKLRLAGDGTIQAEQDPDARQWEEGQEGIRYIRLTDFRNHKDTIIPLSPGVTAIVGDNSIGKSAVLHALRCLCYGDVVDGDIRDDAETQRLEIEIGLEDGNSIILTRQPGRSPVNEWSMRDSAGELIYDQESGHPLQKGGKQPPDFVRHFSGIERMEGLDVQLSHQLFPVFLLGETASRRATVLSIGREAGHIGAMIALQKTRCQQDTQLVRNGEKEIAKLHEELEQLKAIDEVSETLDLCQKTLTEVEEGQRSLTAIKDALDRFDRAAQRHKEAADRISVFKQLPDEAAVAGLQARIEENSRIGELLLRWDRAETRKQHSERLIQAFDQLPTDIPELLEVEQMRQYGRRFNILQSEVSWHQGILATLEGLPKDVPELLDVRDIKDRLLRYERASQRRAEIANRVKQLTAEQQEVGQELDKVLQELGNRCPTCGSHVTSADDIIAHGQEA